MTTTATRTTWSYPAGRTRRELRELVAKVFGWQSGTATGGSTTTVVDGSLARYADGYWTGANIWLASKTNAARNTSWVTDFVSSSGTLTVSPAFADACMAGDVYQLFRYVSKAQIDDAINEVAKGGYAHHHLTPNADLSLVYEINAAPGLMRAEQVMTVWRLSLSDAGRLPVEVKGWRVEEDQGVLTLRLPYAPLAEDDLWLVYQIGEGGLVSDDTRTTVPADLVRARAVVFLLQNILVDQDAQGLEKWGQQLRYWSEELERIERLYQLSGRRVRVYDWRYVERLEQPWASYGLRDRFAPL